MQEQNRNFWDSSADRQQRPPAPSSLPPPPLDGAPAVHALPDVPDIRDCVFSPALMPLRPLERPHGKSWWNPGRVRDQGSNPSCVGHALAAVVDHLRAQSLEHSNATEDKKTLGEPWASWRMLYHTARYHDEWAGESYNGSSIRGALKGFFYNGVCASKDEPQPRMSERRPRDDGWSWYMTKTLLDQARAVQLAAYYRILPRLSDTQAAVSQAGVVLASGYIHAGWQQVPTQGQPEIPFDAKKPRTPEAVTGMHAFAIVGYDESGFWIQNSWGQQWGQNGLAIWRYDDWAANICDAWVLKLAVIPPDERARRYGNLRARSSRINRNETQFLGQPQTDFTGPSRLDVVGHFVPFRDGRLDRFGPYNVDSVTLEQTAELIARRCSEQGEKKYGKKVVPPEAKSVPDDFHYQHVLFYFLGGWPDESKLANDLTNLIPVFTRHGIYPFFVAWDTVLFNELDLLVKRAIADTNRRTEGAALGRRAARDRLIEARIALPGNRLLHEIRRGARRLFAVDQSDPDGPDKDIGQGDGAFCIGRLFQILSARYRDRAISYHFVAHGFGAQTAAECLAQQSQLNIRHNGQSYPAISTCTLISPILAMDRVRPVDDEHARPGLLDWVTARNERQRRRARNESLLVERLRLIVLKEQAMKLDRFSDGYGDAWPVLWTRVMARDPSAIEHERIRMPERRGEIAYLPLLGLDKYARELRTDEASRGKNIELSFIDAQEEDADSSLHEELGFHPKIMDVVVQEILGTRAGEIYFDAGGRKLTIEP